MGIYFAVTCMQIFQINNIRRQNASYSTAAPICSYNSWWWCWCVHCKNHNNFPFTIVQCEVEIVENLWGKFCFFRFSNACTSIYWWTWKVLLTGCNRRFIKSVINALHIHSHMEWFRFIPGAQKMNLLDEESACYQKTILILTSKCKSFSLGINAFDCFR